MSAGFRAFNSLVPAFSIKAAVDIDMIANESFRENLGIRPLQADVASIAKSRKDVFQLLGSPHERSRPLVLIGCAPCQGFSSHRNAAGLNDGRNSLFVDFAMIAAKSEPEVIVIENVPEVVTDRYFCVVQNARRMLNRKGYKVNVSVHNMAEFGVPQERFRTVIIAFKKPFSPISGYLERDAFKTVRDAIGNLPPVRPGERCGGDPMHYTTGHKQSTVETIKAVPKNGGSRPENVGPACLQRAKTRNGRAIYEDVYGRLSWDRPAITITAHARNPASGRYVHPEQDRGLSVREAALLQGFPSEYFFAGSLDQRFRQIGNAVPPAFSAYLAGHVLGELLRDSNEKSEAFDSGIKSPVGVSFSRLIPALKSGHRAIG
jgi:DNA (cytosine-5)-methyltransferase 1